MALPNFLTITTPDIIVKFSCMNLNKRILQMNRNLSISRMDTSSDSFILSRYESSDNNTIFRINQEEFINREIKCEAFFFENTEYPIIVRGNGKDLSSLSLEIAGRNKDSEGNVNIDGGELYGTVNFGNQVGETNFSFVYKLKGETSTKRLDLFTEVFSYKLDYRSDLKTIIADIEKEYAMLSYSFMKDTYLSFKEKSGKSTELIWWQIFKSCYEEILQNAKIIIERPKRRLQAIPKYERAERLSHLPKELENEYIAHKNNPAYLYRTGELILSHDTVENRFLKYALKEIHRKFITVRQHIMTALRLSNQEQISSYINQIDENLLRLINNPFFRGVGQFKGFSQNNLVMQQAVGYKDIFKNWIVLQQGFDLEEGMRKLEVKDISDLYEIWCFIKVKNIVADILKKQNEEFEMKVNGRNVSRDFIPKLIYGGSVTFYKKKNVEFATVSYNAEVEKDTSKITSAIEETETYTTVQRPDIVLRLSRKYEGDIVYTYLFDAKYRIDDTRIDNKDVPPEDAINQMHRYRDAIYYNGMPSLKKEIIGGYVLYPGNLKREDFIDSYYHRSIKKVGIGAFPLRPGTGNLDINPNDSESVLYEQIKAWLEDEHSRDSLLESSIPQKGLEYSDDEVFKGTYFLSTIDKAVNEDKESIIGGTAEEFFSGYKAILSGLNYQQIKYFAPVESHIVKGFYEVDAVEIVNVEDKLMCFDENSKYKGKKQPIRIHLKISSYKKLNTPFLYGILDAFIGTTKTRKQFRELCENQIFLE